MVIITHSEGEKVYCFTTVRLSVTEISDAFFSPLLIAGACNCNILFVWACLTLRSIFIIIVHQLPVKVDVAYIRAGV